MSISNLRVCWGRCNRALPGTKRHLDCGLGGPLGRPFLHPFFLPWKSPNDQILGSQGEHHWEGPGLLWKKSSVTGLGFCPLLYTLGALGPVFSV